MLFERLPFIYQLRRNGTNLFRVIDYTVCNDSNHSTIVYPGWHEIPGTSNYTTTGPVQVELDDWADG
jgi:hypothetical protein